MNDKLLAATRFYFAQCVFMNNLHYKAYNRLSKTQNKNRYITIGISGVTLLIITLHIICLEEKLNDILSVLSYIGMILTATSLIFTMYSKEDIGEIKSQHKNIAEEYKELRDEHMSLIEIIMSQADDEKAIRRKAQEIQKWYSSIGKYSPETTYEDYQGAQKGLGLGSNTNEEFSWSDEEIDRFLPSSLRISDKS
ncbi:hypothetical protein BZG01_07530 [Labilibaculum manganireducens]|uniref:SMODS and SLOG-associating 2TM effector domain-containing protein n=1 Tax=Labilibaculum manganireducens TaxID=1940525 RepID=A0A2N3IB91_9BACT|nr:SLATT domain-containing protein [Labilibaculum manganireducens]PKQ67576.1 hypothetical protein BZG01_07530 [Labilibaculum manganireducens]